MSPGLVLLLAFMIGAVTGMRSMTAPAAVAWAAHLHWINLAGSPLAFMASRLAWGIFTLFAAGEFVADLLPFAPARISPFPLIVRAIVGFLTGACVGVAGGFSFWLCGSVGLIGAIAGAFAGYHTRITLVQQLRIDDAWVAIAEDGVAVGLALLVVSRFK